MQIGTPSEQVSSEAETASLPGCQAGSNEAISEQEGSETSVIAFVVTGNGFKVSDPLPGIAPGLRLRYSEHSPCLTANFVRPATEWMLSFFMMLCRCVSTVRGLT